MQRPSRRPTRLAPVFNRVASRLGLGGDIVLSATAEVVLAPAESIYSPAIVSLPGESSRATGTMAHTNLTEIRKLEEAGEHLHGPTVAYKVPNALLADGCVYAGFNHRVVVPGRRRSAVVQGSLATFGEAQLSSDMPSELYFGHWLTDGLSTELLARDRGIESLVFRNDSRTHEPGYRRLTGVTSTPVASALVDALWVVDDRGMNRGRLDRFHRLREGVRSSRGPMSGAPGKVFIKRSGGTGQRHLADQGALTRRLVDDGFTVIDPASETSEALARTMSAARLVVSIEGSHQGHALLAMPAGGGLLTIQPADRFLHSWKFFADAASIRSGYVIAEPSDRGYVVDSDRLIASIDLLSSAIQL